MHPGELVSPATPSNEGSQLALQSQLQEILSEGGTLQTGSCASFLVHGWHLTLLEEATADILSLGLEFHLTFYKAVPLCRLFLLIY